MSDAKKLFDTGEDQSGGPVKCLGMTFNDNATRREHFRGLLKVKLQDPEFRKLDGFPIGEAEDIVALSDPPYFTACPNPWGRELLAEWQVKRSESCGNDPYQCEPFAQGDCTVIYVLKRLIRLKRTFFDGGSRV